MAARILILFVIFNAGFAYQCSKKTFSGFGPKLKFNCPQYGESSDKIFCCGNEDNQYCCSAQSGMESAFDNAINSFTRITTECTKETWNDNTIRFTCPMIGQSSDMIYCCGKSDNQYCCNSNDLLSVATVVGIVIAAVALLVVVTLVCCCCCSCCLLAKRRERRGAVLVPSKPPDSNTQVFVPPTHSYVVSSNQNAPYPTQTMYPVQQSAAYPSAPPSDYGGGGGYPMPQHQEQYPAGPGFKYGAQPPPYSAN